MTSRIVSKIATGMDTEDGAGVKLKRIIGQPRLQSLDPFLMLDEFKSDKADDYIEGFPSHPHRGFDTITIMLEGIMEHKDNKGNQGILGPGSIQWMSAGSGIIHSEMPKQIEGAMFGFQMWINLPAAQKMRKPLYQDIPAENVPIFESDEIRVRVLAGEFRDIKGPVEGVFVRPVLLDVEVKPNQEFFGSLPRGHSSYAYVFKGKGKFGPEGEKKEVGASQIAILDSKSETCDGIHVKAGAEGVRFLLTAAAPLKEPVCKYGPFVMNTEEEIQEAFDDYYNGRF